jgi:hypothetical protein
MRMTGWLSGGSASSGYACEQCGRRVHRHCQDLYCRRLRQRFEKHAAAEDFRDAPCPCGAGARGIRIFGVDDFADGADARLTHTCVESGEEPSCLIAGPGADLICGFSRIFENRAALVITARFPARRESDPDWRDTTSRFRNGCPPALFAMSSPVDV